MNFSKKHEDTQSLIGQYSVHGSSKNQFLVHFLVIELDCTGISITTLGRQTVPVRCLTVFPDRLHGFGIGHLNSKRQPLFVGNPKHQQADGVGHEQAHGFQSSGSASFGVATDYPNIPN